MFRPYLYHFIRNLELSFPSEAYFGSVYLHRTILYGILALVFLQASITAYKTQWWFMILNLGRGLPANFISKIVHATLL